LADARLNYYERKMELKLKQHDMLLKQHEMFIQEHSSKMEVLDLQKMFYRVRANTVSED